MRYTSSRVIDLSTSRSPNPSVPVSFFIFTSRFRRVSSASCSSPPANSSADLLSWASWCKPSSRRSTLSSRLDCAEFSSVVVDATVNDNVGRVFVINMSSRSVSSGGRSCDASADVGTVSDEIGGGIWDDGGWDGACGSWSFTRNAAGSGIGNGLGIGKAPPDSAFFVSNPQDLCSSFNLQQ